MLLLPTAATRKPCMSASSQLAGETLSERVSPTAAPAGIRAGDSLGEKPPVAVLGRDRRASNAARDARYRAPIPRNPSSSLRWKPSSSAGRAAFGAGTPETSARLARRVVLGARL